MFENDTYGRMLINGIWSGTTYEYLAKGMQPCMRWATRTAVGQKWVIRDYRGNRWRGEATGTSGTQTYYTSKLVNSEAKAYCESLRN